MRDDDTMNVAPHSGHHAEVVEIRLLRDQRHQDLLNEARELMMVGRDAQALEACSEALRLVPGCPQALVLLSTLATVEGHSREGLRFAMEMVQSDPSEADGYYEVAMSLLEMGYPDEALAWLEIGGVHLDGREDEEIADFFTAAQAEALAILSRYEEAEAALEEARRARGDELGLLGEAEERLEWLRRRPRC